jgi:2-dehydro-3-deoxyphosphogluconate aldolase/(4S)-4-hydroxy-2-oxoglutarate aldolase
MTSHTHRPMLPAALLHTRVVAVLRGDDANRVVEAGQTLFMAGITCMEVAFTTPAATDAIAALKALLPETAAVGAGTVLGDGQAREALDAGATFLVTPAPCPQVVETGNLVGAPVVVGALTPGEVISAWESGASAVKIFPAASVGPGHLRDLRGPLPHIPFIPTGGIQLQDAAGYLRAGGIAVGMGSALTGRLDGHEPSGPIRERAQALLDSLSGVAAA